MPRMRLSFTSRPTHHLRDKISIRRLMSPRVFFLLLPHAQVSTKFSFRMLHLYEVVRPPPAMLICAVIQHLAYYRSRHKSASFTSRQPSLRTKQSAGTDNHHCYRCSLNTHVGPTQLFSVHDHFQ